MGQIISRLCNRSKQIRLSIASIGLFWSLAYGEMVYRGFKDKTYSIPILALAANINYEFLHSITPGLFVYTLFNRIWLFMDSILTYQAFKYGPNEFKDVPKNLFRTLFLLSLYMGHRFVKHLDLFFNDGGNFSATFLNTYISLAMIAMFYHRKNLRGQSLKCAIYRFLGNVSWIFLFLKYSQKTNYHSPLAYTMYLTVFIADLLYLFLVWSFNKQQKIKAPENDDNQKIQLLTKT